MIFSFNSCPFIFNYVLKYLTDKFPLDKCIQAFKSNFTVDNQVKTENDINTVYLVHIRKGVSAEGQL